MGRSSTKLPRFAARGGGGGGSGDSVSTKDDLKHSAEYEARQIEILLNQKPRMSMEEYMEKHKQQLEDRMGSGVEREQAQYRKMLDAERKQKLSRGSNNKHLDTSKEDDPEKSKKKKSKKDKKEKKRKDKKEKKKKKDKKREKKRQSSPGDTAEASSGSSSSSSDSESEPSRKRRRKDGEDGDSDHSEGGPVRLSAFHSGKYDKV